jgi:exopolysaccharide biosynthesis polyprenyl glycosylphosphotransferase
MLSHQAKQAAYATALGDALALTLAFVVAYSVRAFAPLDFLPRGFLADGVTLVLSAHLWMLFLCIPAFWILASQAGLYSSLRSRPIGTILWTAFLPFLYLALFLGTAIFLFQKKSFSRAVFFMFLVLAYVFVISVRLVVRWGQTRGRQGGQFHDRRVLIVGTSAQAIDIGRQLADHPDHALKLVGHLRGAGDGDGDPLGLAVVGDFRDLKRIVEREVVDEVIFALPPTELLACEQQISWCEEVGVTVHLKMDFVRTLFARTYPTYWDGVPLLTISSTPTEPVTLLIKKVIDVTVSAGLLLLLSPALLAIAAAIKLTSRGPVIFAQKRVGLNGRVFSFYKFRSMYHDAEARRSTLAALNEVSGPVFKMRRDPRITPVGRFLRKFSLDELPQLWNVLKGEMSLVGPRPPIPGEVENYERWQRRRLSMKPGLTCLWQVNGRSQIGFEEWMRLDLAYIDNWSLKLDFIILLRTVPAVLFARGAH